MEAREGTAMAALAALTDLFPKAGFQAADMEIVGADEMPEPYRGLLAHSHHMTVTLETFHGSEVRLIVDERRSEGNVYARALRLTAGDRGRVVLAGLMRFQMTRCTELVRREILQERVPLGKILIEHCALRKIEPVGYLRIAPGTGIARIFGLDGAGDAAIEAAGGAPFAFAWGRLATISCNLRPVVELLEVVPPCARSTTDSQGGSLP